MNPEFASQMKNMMTPQMMKQASEMFASMPDDQIRSYLSSMGMGHLSPQMFRSMSGNIKNMSDSDLNNVKDKADPTKLPMFSKTSPPVSDTKVIVNEKKYDDGDCFVKKNIVQRLELIKKCGNDFFKVGKYKEACEKYFEVLNEIEYAPDSDRNNFNKELTELEIVNRLNVANCRLKQEDFDSVIYECLKVLKKGTNFKAHYRCGVAFLQKKNYHKAKDHFVKAIETGDGSEDKNISNYIKECDNNIPKEEEEKVTIEKDDYSKGDKFPFQETPGKIQKEEIGSTTNVEPKKMKAKKLETLEKIVEKDMHSASKNEETNNKQNEDDIEIKNDQNTTKRDNISNLSSQSPMLDESKINMAKAKIANMNDNEMNQMVNMFQNMDNETIKNMMSMQGMNIGEDQINMMKNSMSPEMLKMVGRNASLGTTHGNTNKVDNPSSSPDTISTTNTFNSNPTLPNMDMGAMMKMLQNNPDILKSISPQLAGMFGQNADPVMMNNAMQNIMWLISLPSRIKTFFKSPKGIFLSILFVALIIGYVYK